MADLANPSTLLTLTLASLKLAGAISLPRLVVAAPAMIHLALVALAFLLLADLISAKPFPFV
jgi:hypothetical protein